MAEINPYESPKSDPSPSQPAPELPQAHLVKKGPPSVWIQVGATLLFLTLMRLLFG